MLADLLTMLEHLGGLRGKKLVYMGDARFNMANSLMIGCAKMGVNFCVCAPAEFFPDAGLQDVAQELAAESGAVLEFWTEPEMALPGRTPCTRTSGSPWASRPPPGNSG